MARRRSPLARIGWATGPPDRDGIGASLVAAGQRLDLSVGTERSRLGKTTGTDQPWHADAWTYRRAVGEVRYVQDWLGNAVSRMVLYPALVVDGADEPVGFRDVQARDDELVEEFPDLPVLPDQYVADVNGCLSALGDVASLLHRATVNLEVVGEFYLVGYYDADGREVWQVRSRRELVLTDEGYVLVDTPNGGRLTGKHPTTEEGGPRLNPQTASVVRIYRPDPEWTAWSVSPMASVLDRCEELLLLGRKIRASARSRVSAGILKVPVELDTQAAQFDPVTQQYVTPEPLETQLTRHLVTPVSDESSPSSIVPMIVTGPAEALTAFGLVDLGRGADKEDRADRADLLLRVLQGLDAPPEVAKGLGDVKYANARAIDRQSFRDNVEPKVLLLVRALTEHFLRPQLVALNHPADLVERTVVWYNPSSLTSNPDQGEDAQTVYDSGELSGRALRTFRGFSEKDAPSPEERARFLQLKGRPTDSPAAEPDGAPAGADAAVTAAAGPPATSPLGERLLRVDLRLYARTHAAVEAAMRRALDRAGARLRSKAQGEAREVPNERLAAELGHVRLEQLGMTTDDLLGADPFGPVCAQIEVWAEAAFEQALHLTAAALGLRWFPPEPTGALTAAAPPPFSDLGGLDYVDLRERAAADRKAATAALRRRLTALAAERLYQPDLPDEPGERSLSSTVPPGVVRAALARAGGADSSPASSGVDDDGRPVSDDDPLPGGVATGWSLREASARAGLSTTAYEWVHGDALSPFEPHLALDGQTFADQRDGRLLKAPTSWPYGTTSYYPGDHAGCSCWTMYLYADPFAGMTTQQARQVRAQQQARDVRGRFVSGGPSPAER